MLYNFFLYLSFVLNIILFLSLLVFSALAIFKIIENRRVKLTEALLQATGKSQLTEALLQSRLHIIFLSILVYNLIFGISYFLSGDIYKTHILIDIGLTIGHFLSFAFIAYLLKKIK